LADDSDFSLISVDADDEDDVVIHAGTASTRTRPLKEPATDASAPTAVPDEAPGVSAAGPAGHAVLHDDALDSAARAEYMRHLARKKEREENRLTTTEEDLHAHVPFAHMQRALIALALILLVVFAVYWFCFHPLG